ncbi:MAG: PEP-CTERM sorting domain-containing protein [Sphingomonadaceae bacterium]|nr:PEP-CTERM sorting domain-containing protein [Sphingomonadaceae bacterium]
MQRLLVPTLLITVATPAHAGGGIPVPEPSNLALFALGVIGVVLGRYGARRRPPHDRDQDDD